MFKKKPSIKTLSPLRSSDRRKVADRIIKDFHLESFAQQYLDPSPENPSAQQQASNENNETTDKAAATAAHTALRNVLLPDNSLSAKFTTTSGPTLKEVVGTVYVGSYTPGDQRVLWISIHDKLYPSVYTLWKNPGILPLLHTPSIVIQKLKGGADLMTPGLAGPPFPSGATKDSVVAVASLESPTVPVAVGVCAVDVSALTEVRGAKGVAVESVHWDGDELWNWSASGKSGLPTPESLNGWINGDEEAIAKETAGLSLQDAEPDGGVRLEQGQADTDLQTHERNGYVSGEEIPAETVGDSAEDPDLSTKDIDTAFRNAFIYGVHHYKSTNPSQPKYGLTFPLNQSSVMSLLVLPFLPTFTPKQTESLIIKKTSWKNIRKFIKALDKEKLLLSKERPGNEVDVWDIDFDDPAFVNFQPYRLPKKEVKSSETGGKGAGSGSETSDDAIGQKIKKLEYLKPKDSLAPLFRRSNAGIKSLYTSSEIRSIVTDYIENENLISPQNKRHVTLNPQLSNILFDPDRSSMDAEVLSRGTIPRDALIDRIRDSYCTPYHAIIRETNDDLDATSQTAKSKAKAGAPPKIEIILETRSGNKTATRVHGLEAYFIRPQPLADELRKTCASSTSVEPFKGGKPGTMEVMVQGPQKDAMIKALERRGVNKQWVGYTDKTKGKGKGK